MLRVVLQALHYTSTSFSCFSFGSPLLETSLGPYNIGVFAGLVSDSASQAATMKRRALQIVGAALWDGGVGDKLGFRILARPDSPAVWASSLHGLEVVVHSRKTQVSQKLCCKVSACVLKFLTRKKHFKSRWW